MLEETPDVVPLTRLACKHDHNPHSLLVEDEYLDGKGDEEEVETQERPEDADHAGMEESRYSLRLLQELDSVKRQPVEHLEKKQRAEENHKARVELVAEDGHGKERLGDGVPRPLVEVLDLDCAQLSKEDCLADLAEHEGDKDGKVEQDQHAAVAAGQPYRCRVEVGAFSKRAGYYADGRSHGCQAVDGESLRRQRRRCAVRRRHGSSRNGIVVRRIRVGGAATLCGCGSRWHTVRMAAVEVCTVGQMVGSTSTNCWVSAL